MNGQKAVDLIKQNYDENENKYSSYSLILMDCNMPILDGYEATKQIRSFIHSKGLPQPVIIAITGHMEDSYIDRANKCGMNEVSPKPIYQILIGNVLRRLQLI